MPVIALTGVTANVTHMLGGIVVFGHPLGHGRLARAVRSPAFALVIVGSTLVPAEGGRAAATRCAIESHSGVTGVTEH